MSTDVSRQERLPKKMVSFRLDRRLIERLDAAYWRLRRPRAEIVRAALERYLNEVEVERGD